MTVVRKRRQQGALKLELPPPVVECQLRARPPVSSSPDSPSIDSLSDLERLSVLGHGSGGTVYKVIHRRTGKIYAMKAVRCDQNVTGLLHEEEILKRVSSRFVIRSYAVLDVDSSPESDLCFVMEYMEGGSLRDLLGTCGRLPERVISDVATGVLQGLHYLHSMQIIHRDIKPSNLLMDGRGEIKIADFGVSRVWPGVKGSYRDSYAAGTCAYMSPERFDQDRWGGGDDDADGFAGDVWALGVVVLECYLGRFPLISPGQKPDWATLMWAVCFGEVPKVPEAASPEFRDFVGRCLERDWRRRATVDELLSHPFVNRNGGGIGDVAMEKHSTLSLSEKAAK